MPVKFVEVRALKMKRSELKQLRVVFNEHQGLRNAIQHVGWFYGEAVLGKEYSNCPYVLCVDVDDMPYLVRVEFPAFDGNNLTKLGYRIPQVIVG